MKIVNIILFIMISFTYLIKAQNDTIIFNPKTKNYLVKFYDGDKGWITVEVVPGNKIVPSVWSSVKVGNKNQLIYQWSIKNENESEQNLNEFNIKYKDSLAVVTSSIWHNMRSEDVDKNGNTFFENLLYCWGDQGLAPGWPILKGFTMESYGMPTIGIGYFGGISPIPRFPSIPSDELIDKLSDQVCFPNGYVKRKILVPNKIDFAVSPFFIIDTLKTYCDSSYSFGWIKDKTIKTKYKNYLNSAKDNLEKEEGTKAKNYLNQLLTDLEADSLNYLTDEAYALLKYNTEYLLYKIKEGGKN